MWGLSGLSLSRRPSYDHLEQFSVATSSEHVVPGGLKDDCPLVSSDVGQAVLLSGYEGVIGMQGLRAEVDGDSDRPGFSYLALTNLECRSCDRFCTDAAVEINPESADFYLQQYGIEEIVEIPWIGLKRPPG